MQTFNKEFCMSTFLPKDGDTPTLTLGRVIPRLTKANAIPPALKVHRMTEDGPIFVGKDGKFVTSFKEPVDDKVKAKISNQTIQDALTEFQKQILDMIDSVSFGKSILGTGHTASNTLGTVPSLAPIKSSDIFSGVHTGRVVPKINIGLSDKINPAVLNTNLSSKLSSFDYNYGPSAIGQGGKTSGIRFSGYAAPSISLVQPKPQNLFEYMNELSKNSKPETKVELRPEGVYTVSSKGVIGWTKYSVYADGMWYLEADNADEAECNFQDDLWSGTLDDTSIEKLNAGFYCEMVSQ
jgi:hypothetical protein